MKESSDEKLCELLKHSMQPWADVELKHDLWPRMLQKFDERAYRVAWFEWAVLLLVGILLVFFPGVIPALFYQL